MELYTMEMFKLLNLMLCIFYHIIIKEAYRYLLKPHFKANRDL